MAESHSVVPAQWRRTIDLVIDSFAGRFCRVEPRRAAAGFVTGLLTDLETKTCWQVAEQAGHARPDAMQRLLYRAKWDADAVRDDVRRDLLAGQTTAPPVATTSAPTSRSSSAAGPPTR